MFIALMPHAETDALCKDVSFTYSLVLATDMHATVFNEDTLDAALGSFARQDHPDGW
jgi:hypothetical protein